MISPRMYRKYVLPRLQRLMSRLDVPTILHICGDTTSIIKDMAQSDPQILDLDWQVDLAHARTAVDEIDPEICLCGNFDPVAVLYNGNTDEVTTATLHCRAIGGDNWLAQPGCEIPRHTPAANLHALSKALNVH